MKTALVFAGLVLASALVPPVASAQSNDNAYCTALSDTYLRYVYTRGSRGARSSPTADISAAMSKCRTSDAASAIPVLEEALRNNKINLPPRG
jgi:hypothetical protein